ncbi:hypothetical protein ACIQNU_04140 [Streptomyces sp. NPDC091292]|uniref:hypothetical protein n=1 Tax=Streptomyces sp. NPDC091292 TaxID=3365991 RepID=UPI00380E671D
MATADTTSDGIHRIGCPTRDPGSRQCKCEEIDAIVEEEVTEHDCDYQIYDPDDEGDRVPADTAY